MDIRFFYCIILLSCCLYSPNSQAISLSDLALLALDEPNYQSALADQQAAQARYRQTRAALLPQLSASANSQANQRTYQARQSLFFNNNEEKERYNTHGWQVNFSQPLWRYQLWADRAQAKAQRLQSDFQLVSAEQNTLNKLLETWLDCLMARDQLHLIRVQVQVANEQHQVIARGIQLGLRSAPDMAEALSKQAQARSDLAAAEYDFALKQATLAVLIGQSLSPRDFPQLKPVITFNSPNMSLETWLSLVMASNAEIQSAYYQQEAAREEVGKQLGGYLPQVDLVANYSDSAQGAGSTPSQSGYDSVQHYVGIQANWSLWQSGGQYAKVQEAHARLAKAQAQLELAKRNSRFYTQQAWYNQQIALNKQHSGLQALVAAKARLHALQSGQTIGLKSTFDTLQAQEQLASAERDYRKAVYQQLLAFIKLEALANQLTAHDIQQIDALFESRE